MLGRDIPICHCPFQGYNTLTCSLTRGLIFPRLPPLRIDCATECKLIAMVRKWSGHQPMFTMFPNQ